MTSNEIEQVMLKNSPQFAQLKEAMELIRELKIPDHLQEKALAHLLHGPQASAPANPAESEARGGHSGSGTDTETSNLREFIAKYRPKGAVEEIPALIHWARKHENTDSFNENDIVSLYRRADIRPPKHVAQSMRDLSSKKYLRLKAVVGKTGHVNLSRPGEDFIMHDLMKRKAT
jgi:hypothetical protein